jgi:formylglycine-generating enzyme required for sulfatase activity
MEKGQFRAGQMRRLRVWRWTRQGRRGSSADPGAAASIEVFLAPADTLSSVKRHAAGTLCGLAPGLLVAVAVVSALPACKRDPAVESKVNVRKSATEAPPKPSPAQLAQKQALATLAKGATRFVPTPGFVLIPAGTFTMGVPPAELDPPGSYNDAPQHRVTLTRAFEMKATEVTESEYADLMAAAPRQKTGCDACPVTNVSWFQAVAYCNQLSKRRQLPPCYVIDGFRVEYLGPACPGYRLPTEAEWEWAARAGTESRRFDMAADVHDLAWVDTNSGAETPDGPALVKHEVGRKRKNPFGVHDLYGNAWEWVWDWMVPYPIQDAVDPRGPETGENRALRGGGYKGPENEAVAGFRLGYGPGNQVEFVGFRVVRSVGK